MEKRIPTPVLLICVFALLLGACGIAGGDDSTAEDSADTVAFEAEFVETSGDEAMEEADEAMEAGEEAPADVVEAEEEAPTEARSTGSALGTGQDTNALQPVDTGRKIVFRASITVGVDDVQAASSDALGTIEGLGGLLFGQETTSTSETSSTLTFKVPPDQFQTALARLGGLGSVWSQSVTADDVTERVVDLESRIITAEASVERLRGFLAEASELETIAQLEQQLLQRETDLELLRGQVRTLENQVSLATITIRFVEDLPGPAIDVTQTAYRGHDGGLTCPGSTEIGVEADEEITICFAVRNIGDVALDGLELRDEVLDVGIDELTLVDGDDTTPFEPGDTRTYATERRLDETLRTQVRVTAVPVDADGNPLGLERVRARGELRVFVEVPEEAPGFGDGLDAGVSTLAGIGRVLAVLAGFVLPFIWVLPIVWFGGRWVLQRRRLRSTPPPPAPPAD